MEKIEPPRPGEKMAPEQARRYVDDLYRRVRERWEEKIDRGEFMRRLREGALPLPVIRQFFRNWGRFWLELNALNALSYYTHLPFFMRHFDLLGSFCAKIGEELSSPEPPGQVVALLRTAERMGLEPAEILEAPSLPEARAIHDFCHRIFLDGSLVELWAMHAFEEPLERWAEDWRQALTGRYGFSAEDALYFSSRRAEAGKESSNPAAFNRAVLQRALETGAVECRTGYSLEYCAVTVVDLQAQMERAAIENPYSKG
jgi:pyrroloquinoline quinone (PQQ) biosynthesis protein C